MTKKLFRALVVTTALTGAMPAFAQQDSRPAEEVTASDEIIVSARRSDERLQDVPVSVQVVSGAKLQDLAITSIDEISKLTPGLNLTNQGSSTIVVLRGVTWQPGSGTPATPIYLNEVPFDPETTIQSLFDVGQIEVLRGPQGTSRGAPSISGAVTITTRKPDLDGFGGYVQAAYGTADRWNVQGAINIPVIKNVLAIRLAGFAETNDYNRVYSIHSTIQPKLEDRTLRASVLFKPTDTVTIEAMYQRRKTTRVSYEQVVGTGSPGFATLGIPAGFNGPALTLADRASVQDAPTRSPQHIDLLTVNASWDVLGHTLTYNFGRQFTRTGTIFNANDPLNILPGFEPYNSFFNQSLPKFSTHEIRVSSKPNPDRPFDYDIGWFSKHSGGTIIFDSPNFLPGAFGAPFQSVPGQVTSPNPRYILNSSTGILLGQTFDSFYGNVRFHLDDRTELSGGLAIVRDRVVTDLNVGLGTAFAALPIFLPPPSGCQGIPPAFYPFVGITYPSPVYGPAYCEAFVGPTVPRETHNDKYTDALYNFSLSHKFSDDLLVYATTGTSFRTGLPAINNPGLPGSLLVPKAETATSYELGIKSSFGRRLRVNASVFQLNYKNQLTRFEGVTYFSTVTNAADKSTGIAFYGNIDSRVRGAELEVSANPVDNLTLGANIAYSRITSKGGLVPCNNPALTLTAANPIAFCPSVAGEVLNTTAPFQATVNGSYQFPVTDTFGGYFRFNVNYQGNNPNYGNYKTGTTFRSTPGYAVVDLFAGVSGGNGSWDLGLYAKNVFDKQVELARVLKINDVFPLFAAPSGYDLVRTNTPREIGVTLRYSFGSR